MLRWQTSSLLLALWITACAWEPGNPPVYEMDEHLCDQLTAVGVGDENQYMELVTGEGQNQLLLDGSVHGLVFPDDVSTGITLHLVPEIQGVYGLLTTREVIWKVWNEEDGPISPTPVDVTGCDRVAQASWFALHPEEYHVSVSGAPRILHLLTVVMPDSEPETDSGHEH